MGSRQPQPSLPRWIPRDHRTDVLPLGPWPGEVPRALRGPLSAGVQPLTLTLTSPLPASPSGLCTLSALLRRLLETVPGGSAARLWGPSRTPGGAVAAERSR